MAYSNTTKLKNEEIEGMAPLCLSCC